MRDIAGFSGKILSLVELLAEMGQLEIRAEVRQLRGSSGETGLAVDLSGRDTAILTADNGRVLDAIESLAMDMLGLSDAERERVHFDAGNFLSDQTAKLRLIARSAIDQVEFTGTPHVFPPMSLRDRRLLEPTLLSSGLSFETLGQHSARWVILFPKESTGPMESSEALYSSRN